MCVCGRSVDRDRSVGGRLGPGPETHTHIHTKHIHTKHSHDLCMYACVYTSVVVVVFVVVGLVAVIVCVVVVVVNFQSLPVFSHCQ
jgi:Ni/Fe-hydrogenase subunit HybB-like protein